MRIEIGPVREAVERDLQKLPEDLRESGPAISALALADAIDLGPERTFRVLSTLVGELRETLESLAAKAPPEVEGDAVDDLNARRAARRRAASAG